MYIHVRVDYITDITIRHVVGVVVYPPTCIHKYKVEPTILSSFLKPVHMTQTTSNNPLITGILSTVSSSSCDTPTYKKYVANKMKKKCKMPTTCKEIVNHVKHQTNFSMTKFKHHSANNSHSSM